MKNKNTQSSEEMGVEQGLDVLVSLRLSIITLIHLGEEL